MPPAAAAAAAMQSVYSTSAPLPEPAVTASPLRHPSGAPPPLHDVRSPSTPEQRDALQQVRVAVFCAA